MQDVKVYKQRKKSDEEVRQEDLTDGLVVWVGSLSNRVERVFFQGRLLPLDEYIKVKREKAAYNRSRHAQQYNWRGEENARKRAATAEEQARVLAATMEERATRRDHYFFAFS